MRSLFRLGVGLRQRPGLRLGTSVLSFRYQRTITANNSTGTAKTDYPVRIDLTSGNFNFTRTQSDGRDILFQLGGATVPHWIESWDSVGQTASIWVKFATIAATSSPTFNMYYGSASATDVSNIQNVFIFGEDFSSIDRLIGVPDQTPTAITNNQNTGITLGNKRSMVAASGTAGTWNQTVREQSNVIYDTADADPNKRYKFYYTGQDISVGGASTGARRIGLAYSPDGFTWTDYASNPVIGNGTSDRGEDPYIVRNIDGSLYRDASNRMHLFSEDQAQADMLHYYSTNGISWTADPANPILVRGTAGSYDDGIVASPIVVHLGGNNSFLMMYESRLLAATDTCSIARSTTLMGANWTKDATNNPIFPGDVPDDLIYTGTQWILLYHVTSGNLMRAATSVTNTALWTNTSFADLGPNPLYGSSGFSYNAIPETTNYYGRRLTIQPNGTTAFDVFDSLGSTIWGFQNLNASAPSNPYTRVINAKGDGVLVLDPSGDAADNYTLMAYTKALSLTSDFMLMCRRKSEVTTDDQLSQIGFGTGTPQITAGAPSIAWQPDGFYFLNANPGTGSDFQFRKYAATALTTPVIGAMSAAEANAYNIHEVSYLATGALAYRLRGGANKISTTDSAFVATSKQIMLSQGMNISTPRPGAKFTIDWVAVRKYDGQDPATTVAAEAAYP